MSGDKKNPWGNYNDNNRGGRGKGGGNHGGGRGGSGGGEPPDIDDMLRKASEALPMNVGGGGFIILALLVILALWAVSGFYVVTPGEHAVIQRFGAHARTQTAEGLGYHFPAPIESRSIVNVNVQRSMSIGFAEIRGGQKRNVPEESLMLTSDRNIIDLDLVILWTIKSAENFLFEIRDQENTIKKVAESAIREVVGQTDMFPIITRDRATVASRAQEIIQKNLDEYNSGVSINQVLIQQAEVHPDVQNAFQDVQSAKQDGEDTQNRAEAYREDILPKARGQAEKLNQQAQAYKQSTVARATGDAERFNSVYKAYLSGETVTKQRLYIETMEDVLKNAQTIILDNNNGQGSGVVPYLPLNELGKKR